MSRKKCSIEFREFNDMVEDSHDGCLIRIVISDILVEIIGGKSLVESIRIFTLQEQIYPFLMKIALQELINTQQMEDFLETVFEYGERNGRKELQKEIRETLGIY